MRAGIQPVIRRRGRNKYLHVSGSYPLGGVAPGRGPRRRPRKNPDGVVSRRGVIDDCPACVARRRKLHPAHARNSAPLLLCMRYQYEPGKWSCEARLATRPAVDPAHVLEEGCRSVDVGLGVARRMKKQFGEQAEALPCRDHATPGGGEVGGWPITCDDLGSDVDVLAAYDEAFHGEGAFGIFKGSGRVVTKEEEG